MACPSNEDWLSVPWSELSKAKLLLKPGPSSPTPSARIRTLHQVALGEGGLLKQLDSAVSVTSRIDGFVNVIVASVPGMSWNVDVPVVWGGPSNRTTVVFFADLARIVSFTAAV